jgi:hypothetical protein
MEKVNKTRKKFFPEQPDRKEKKWWEDVNKKKLQLVEVNNWREWLKINVK